MWADFLSSGHRYRADDATFVGIFFLFCFRCDSYIFLSLHKFEEMQSYLQFRRFRTAVEAQLERDQARASIPIPRKHDTVVPGEAESSLDSPSSGDDKIDLEKGDTASVDSGTRALPSEHQTGEHVLPAQRGEAVEELKEEEHEAQEELDQDDYELGLNLRPTLSRTTTQQSAGTALGTVLTGIDVRRRTTREGGDGNVFVVGYEGADDPNDPHNWSLLTRIRCTFTIAAIGCVVGFASAIDSSALPQAAKDFGVSEVVESLATGLFLVGFGLGALVAGPISETVGRNPVYIATLALYMVFILASALAPNIGAQLAFRFMAGIFGATPLTCAGGSISDLWNPLERVITFPIFANAAFTGPLLGPVIGGFIAESSAVSWRWVEWSKSRKCS